MDSNYKIKDTDSGVSLTKILNDAKKNNNMIWSESFGDVIVNGKTEKILLYIMKSKKGLMLCVSSYGASIVSIGVPDRNGTLTDIALGFDHAEGYFSSKNPYMGATIGRVCNRTADNEFKIGDRSFRLATNRGNTHLHGGKYGLHQILWSSFVDGDSVVFSCLSPDGQDGYPGDLMTFVRYTVTDDNSVNVEMRSVCNSPTPVNLTNHAYFNLSGHNTGASELLKHKIYINASNYTELNEDLVTTGVIIPVNNTPYDLQKLTILSDRIPDHIAGYDINYCIDVNDNKHGDAMIAQVISPTTGICLRVYSNQPGVQFYTSNFFPERGDDIFPKGKNSAQYYKHGGFCLEPQNYPNALSHKNFPNCILKPGSDFICTIRYEFSISED